MAISSKPKSVDTSLDPAFNTPQVINRSPNTEGIVGPFIDSTYVSRRPEIINEPGGSTGMVQYSAGGSFGGDRNFTYNANTKTLYLSGNIVLGGYVHGRFTTNLFNFKITGGQPGQQLTTDGTGNLSWQDPAEFGYGDSDVANFLANYNGDLLAHSISVPDGNAYLANITSTGHTQLGNVDIGGDVYLDVSQLYLLGGQPDQVLRTDGAGNLSWGPAAGLQHSMVIGETSVTLDEGGSNSVWTGPFDIPPAIVTGVGSSNSTSNSLFTFSSSGTANMSVALDGSLFVGSNVGDNPYNFDYNEPGWVVAERGLLITDQAGSIIFPDGTQQFTAYTGGGGSNVTSLLDLGITDGNVGEVLTTDGNGHFSFQPSYSVRLDGGSASTVFSESDLAFNGGGA